MAGEAGIEPALSVSETDMLPLHHSPINAKGAPRNALVTFSTRGR